MKTRKHHWIKRLLIIATVAALPQAVIAGTPVAADTPPACIPKAFVHDRLRPPDIPPEPGNQLPWLHGIELSEAQQDKLFELTLAENSAERTLERKAGKAIEQLHRLAASERYDAGEARRLADSHAQALALLTLSQAELEVKVRALLTPEQRQTLAEPGPQERRSQPGGRATRPSN